MGPIYVPSETGAHDVSWWILHCLAFIAFLLLYIINHFWKKKFLQTESFGVRLIYGSVRSTVYAPASPHHWHTFWQERARAQIFEVSLGTRHYTFALEKLLKTLLDINLEKNNIYPQINNKVFFYLNSRSVFLHYKTHRFQNKLVLQCNVCYSILKILKCLL